MQTIGQRLKAAREEKNLTLEKVFQAVRIRVNYLKALEDDDLSSMPSPVQARGYLRNYAEYLGLDLDRILEEVRLSGQNAGGIIPPVDFTAPPTSSTPEPGPSREAAPPSPPTVDSVRAAEPQTLDASVETIQDTPESERTKPKRGSRKKTETSTDGIQDESTIVKTRRRGRKTAEPAEEIVREKPEPEPAQTPEPQVEETPPQPEPVTETPEASSAAEQPPQPDVSETLWQTWLNRVSAVISTRKRNKLETKDDQAIEETGASDVPPSQEELSPPEPSQPENPHSSDEIFKEIGVELRERRQMLSLHLEEVERNTKVKAHYLEALEEGALDRLPSTVQTRGMLSNYASFLDMDVDVILLRFADALQARHRERNPQQPVRKPGQPILANMPALRNFIAGDMIFGIGMAVLLVGFVIWGINRVLTIQNQEEVQPTAPSISDDNIYRADEIITPTPLATATPTDTAPPSPTSSPTNSPVPSNTPLP
jgi:cytoskeletal protein RodZ